MFCIVVQLISYTGCRTTLDGCKQGRCLRRLLQKLSSMYRTGDNFHDAISKHPDTLRVWSIDSGWFLRDHLRTTGGQEQVDDREWTVLCDCLRRDELKDWPELRSSSWHRGWLGGELPQKRTEPCNEALVFMVRGLKVRWKQTLGFFFAQNASGAPDLCRLFNSIQFKIVYSQHKT